MYLKESSHAHNSQSMINDQISIAMETKEHLLSQRQSFKRLQTRFNDLSNRFPVISRFVELWNFFFLWLLYLRAVNSENDDS